jgi:Uma2 family endonuclease
MADWEAVPPPYTAHLLGGKLHVHPRPVGWHSEALGGVYSTLREPFHRGNGGPGGWLLLQEVDVRLASDIVAPDLAGWHRDRLPQAPNKRPILLAPDWVCEVLSPRTEVFDRGEKADWYRNAGVSWLWFVDPEAQTLEVYASDAGAWRQRLSCKGNATVAAPPFEALTWSLASLWA